MRIRASAFLAATLFTPSQVLSRGFEVCSGLPNYHDGDLTKKSNIDIFKAHCGSCFGFCSWMLFDLSMTSGFAEWMPLVRECDTCGSVSFVFVVFCFVFLLLLLPWFC